MRYSVTIDDTSPIIEYSGLWIDSSPSDTSNYMDDTFHSTNDNSSFASFTFTGVGVSVFGSQGPDHGTFAVTLDNDLHLIDSFDTTNAYQVQLFSRTGLTYGKHTITVRNVVQNVTQPWLYLDYFRFETGLDDDVKNESFNIDDTNSTVIYSPTDAWSTISSTAGPSSGDTSRVSNTPGASIVTEFEGNAVYIYGGLAPSYGVMDVTIDGDATTRINCSSAIPRPNTLLFYSNDFDSGKHLLAIQIPANSTSPIEFDYLTIIRWSDNNGLGEGRALTPIIAGSICAALILLAWMTYLGHWAYLRWQKQKKVSPEMRKVSDALALRTEKNKSTEGTE